MPFPISGSPTPAGSANPSPAYTGVFIPTVWAEALAKSLYDLTLAGKLVSTQWDIGEGKPGDKVKIMTEPLVTTQAYEANQALAAPQRPSHAIDTLDLNKGWYYSTVIDDVMKKQSMPNLPQVFGKQGALQLKYDVEDYILNTVLPSSIDAKNAGLTAGILTDGINLGVAGTPLQPAPVPGVGEMPVVDLFTRLSQALDEQKAPSNGRWCVVPPWIAAMVGEAESVIAHDSSFSTRAENNPVARIARLDIYSSATLDSVYAGETSIFAGHPDAIAYATQLSEPEEIRSRTSFQTYVRGLIVCGGLTVNPKLIAKAVVTS